MYPKPSLKIGYYQCTKNYLYDFLQLHLTLQLIAIWNHCLVVVILLQLYIYY